MKRLSKKGFQLNQIPALAIVLVVVAIILGLGATVLDKVQSTQTTDSLAFNITQDGLEGQETMSDFQGTWAVIIAAAVIIGIVGRYLFFRG